MVNAITAIVNAPISEDLLKGLALLILILTQRRKLDSLTDFLIYACAVGIGFELVENILYQWSTFDQGNQVAGWMDEFNNRSPCFCRQPCSLLRVAGPRAEFFFKAVPAR